MIFKNKKIIATTTLILYMFFVFSSTAYALGEYTVLAPLPGVQDADGETNFETYLPNVFNLTIGIAAVMAFVMITFGGIMYATSDAISGKSQGREYVKNALTGLLLVISAWARLNTINPKILNFSLDIQQIVMDNNAPPVAPAGPYTGERVNGILPGYTLTPEQVAEDARIEASLGDKIVVNNNPCITGGTIGCTNLVGLPPNAITGIRNLQNACDGCYIRITGGTEGGHATHGPGMASVDLSPLTGLNRYLAKTNPRAASPTNNLRVTVGGATYTFESTGANGRATAPHWHVTFD